MTPRWQLGETGAEAYERYLVPAFFAPFAQRLLELASPQPGERMLDVACGTGIVSRLAVSRLGDSGKAVGLDSNPRMLEVARASAPDTGPPIEWLAADAADLPLPDRSFDVVVCQQGVQFFADRPAALLEMRRVLAPGGRLAISVWRGLEHQPGFAALVGALDRHAGPDVGAILRTPFSGPGAEQLREEIRSAGLRDVAVRIRIAPVRFPSPQDFLLRQADASPLGGPFAALTDERRGSLVRDLTETMRPYTDDDGVVFPLQTHVVTATL